MIAAGRASAARRTRGLAVVVRLVAGLTAVVTLPATGHANWLSKIVREAGETGGKAGSKLGHGALDNAALHVRSLPPGGGVSLAAHATPEGHWRFVNRQGEVYTAGTPDELKRVVAALAPEATGEAARLSLHLSEATVFAQRAMIRELPADARLHVVIGKSSYPLHRTSGTGGDRLLAEVRPNVAVALADRTSASEALFQLGRPLQTSRMRVVSLRPGAADALPTVPRFDPASKVAMVDEIDPASLGQALGRIRGQTAVLTGRIAAGQLHFRPPTGGERSLPLADIERAAAAADVNLVVLQSAVTSQPGGRNWLWQRVAVSGLDDALKRATFADFLNALGAGRGRFEVETVARVDGRVALKALLAGSGSEPLGGKLGEWMSDVVSEATGNVVTSAVEVMATSEDRQRELDARIVPGIPAAVQLAYLGGIVAGLIGLPFARRWWGRLWPPERRPDYASASGFHAARFAKLLAFLVLFLPLAGAPALLATVAMQLWSLVTAPWRFARWVAARLGRGGSAATG
jgi:hypothetical protein